MGPKALQFIQAVARKLLAKPAKPGEGITSIANRMQAEAKAGEIAETFRLSGLTPDKWDDFLKSEKDVTKYLNIIESSKPKGPTILGHPVIDATSPEGKGITRDLFNMLDRQSGKNVIKTDFGGGITDIVTETITKIKSKKPIEAMAEANSVLARKGKYKNLTEEQSQKIIKDTEDHIFERNVDVDPEDFAHGGRTGSGLNYLLGEDDQNSRVPYGEGGTTQEDFNQFLKEREQRDKDEEKRKFKKDYEDWKKWQKTQGGTVDFAAEGGRMGFGLGGMGRRAFLKWLGAGAAGAGAAKSGLLSIFKGGATKSVIKDLASVPIKDISGMPVWFKPLVNKVIKEGDDVTKKFGTVDREIVHKTKLPDSQTDVIVTQDLTTGNVSVDIGMGKHGFKDGLHGQPVRLEYKAAEDIMIGPDMDDMHKVGVRDPHIKVKSRDEMTFDQKKHPDKAPEEFWVEEAEFTGGHPENVKFEETISEKFGQHGSNFDEVEKFATGKVKKAKTKETRFLGKKYLSEGDDMASGGRVPMWLGGGLGAGKSFIRELVKKLAKDKGMTGSQIMKVLNPKAYQKFLDDPANVHKWEPKTGLMASEKAKQLMKSTKGARAEQLEHYLGMAKSSKEGDENIKKLIDAAMETGMSRESAERMAKGLREGIDIEDLIPRNVTDETILDMEQMLKNLKTEGRQLNATGGRVPLGGGGDPGTSSAEEVREAWKDYLKEKGKGTFRGSWQEWQPIWIRANLAQGGRASLSSGGLAGMLGE